ncbi:hypothetical protein J1614_009426 [Plenodomus biglobosus]|nr:hypothetical protein J1614_009426 [Plenodomus biglobosus]
MLQLRARLPFRRQGDYPFVQCSFAMLFTRTAPSWKTAPTHSHISLSEKRSMPFLRGPAESTALALEPDPVPR